MKIFETVIPLWSQWKHGHVLDIDTAFRQLYAGKETTKMPVYTKDDNCKDNYKILIIVQILWE